MKKTVLALVSLALAVLLCSCGNSDVPDGMISVSPASVSFNLYVPKSWADNSASGTASAVYSSSDTSNVSMTAMVADNEYYDLDTYLVYADKCLAEALPDYELIYPVSSSAEETASSATESSAVESSSAVNPSQAETGSSAVSSGIALAASDTKLAGIKAKTFDYTAKLGDTVYKFRQIVCVRGNNFYVFTYTSTSELFDSHLEDVSEILANISFK